MKTLLVQKVFFLLTITFILCSGGKISALELARNGKTDYVIVRAANQTYSTNKLIEATTKDLAELLKKSTGATFPVVTTIEGKKYSKRIFLGTSNYSRTVLEKGGKWKDVKNEEQRIVTCGNDLFLYGGGHGNGFAAYRFLTKHLSFRFYHYWGDSFIPQYKVLETGNIDELFRPAFEYRDLAQSSFNLTHCPTHQDYFRRNMLHNNSLLPYNMPGAMTHSYTKLIPPTKNHPQAYKFLKDKAYFVTDPEFFPLSADGKRVAKGHRCFSNEKLRAEMNKNVELLLRTYKIKNNADVVVNISHDDIDCKFCYCKNCIALEKKYNAPGGPLYDYLIHSASPYFAKKYPNLIIRFLAYGRLTTEIPPSPESLKKGKLPANLMPHLAFLTADFNKSFDAPSNAFIYKCLTSWGKVARRISFYFYPSTYGRPMIQFPLFGNAGRVIKDLRLGAENNVTQIFCDYASLHRHCNTAFSGLMNYTMARIYEDGAKVDVEKTIDEYMNAIYKKAAPGMRKFYNELHALAAKDPTFVKWFPDPRNVNYLTSGRLYKWQKDFDAMEKAVANDPSALLHVRGERLSLDAMTLLLYKEFSYAGYSKAYPAKSIYERALHTANEAIKRSYVDKSTKDKPDIIVEHGTNSILHTLGLFYGMAKYHEKLPAGFGKVPEKDRYYIFFSRLKVPPEVMKEAPFGYALPANLPGNLTAQYDFVRSPEDGPSGTALKVKNATDKFEYHYLTRTTLTPSSIMGAPRKKGYVSKYFGAYGFYATCSLGHLFDPANPLQQWDIYVSVKFSTEKQEMATSHLLLVKVVPGRKPFVRKSGQEAVMKTPAISILPAFSGKGFPAEKEMGDLPAMRNAVSGEKLSGNSITLKGAISENTLYLFYREKDADKEKGKLEVMLPSNEKYPVTHLEVSMDGKTKASSWSIPVTSNPDDMQILRTNNPIPFPGKVTSLCKDGEWVVCMEIALNKKMARGDKLMANIFRSYANKKNALAISPVYTENYLDGFRYFGMLYKECLVLKDKAVKAPIYKDGICVMDGNKGWAITVPVPYGLDPAGKYIIAAYLKTDAKTTDRKVATRVGCYNQITKKITGYAVMPVMELAKEYKRVSSEKSISLPVSSLLYVGGFLPHKKINANVYLREFVIEKSK